MPLNPIVHISGNIDRRFITIKPLRNTLGCSINIFELATEIELTARKNEEEEDRGAITPVLL